MDESFCLFFGEDDDPSVDIDQGLEDMKINEPQSFNQLPPEVTLLLFTKFYCLLLLFVFIDRRGKH